MSNLKTLIYDIEVSPCLGWFWRAGKQQITPNNILRPNKIICISYRFTHWRQGRVENLKWKRKKRSNRFSYTFSDRTMVEKFAKIAEGADILVGHNGDNFDRKLLNARLAYYNIPTLKHHMTEDTLKQSRRQFNLPSHSLNFLCKYFNLPGKLSTPTGLWEEVVFKGSTKSLKKMVDYCDQDVLILDRLYHRIKPYVDPSVSFGNIIDDREVCPSCGSKHVVKRGFRYTKLGKYQRYVCRDCGSWSHKGKRENATPSSEILR